MNGKILYFARDNQFMGYYYHEQGEYILDISFDVEYIITFDDVNIWIDELDKIIKCIKRGAFKICVYRGRNLCCSLR